MDFPWADVLGVTYSDCDPDVFSYDHWCVNWTDYQILPIPFIKNHKKHGTICSSDITNTLLYLLMAAGAALFQHVFL